MEATAMVLMIASGSPRALCGPYDNISMRLCKKDVTPLLTHWSYVRYVYVKKKFEKETFDWNIIYAYTSQVVLCQSMQASQVSMWKLW